MAEWTERAELLFKEEGFARLINCLEKFKIPYEVVDVLPFVEDFDFKTDRQDVFCFGTLKLFTIVNEYFCCPEIC